MNKPRCVTYSGFTLTTFRQDECGGWYPIVKDRQGRLVRDEVEAPWISQSQAEKRAVDIAKRALEEMGETAPEDPSWGDICGPFDDA